MLTAHQVQLIEKTAFAKGVHADELMEKVGLVMAGIILSDYPSPGRVVAFLGKGHNAGDALVVLRHLQRAGWQTSIRCPFPEEELAPLTLEKLRLIKPQESALPRQPLLLLDGLLGIGAKGALQGSLGELGDEMNQLRLAEGARTIAMDIPSGLHPDDGSRGHVIADHTLTVGIPKSGLVVDSAIDFVGRLTLIKLSELPIPTTGDQLITPSSLRPLFPPRPFSYHKGQAGRVAIIAGSPGLLGAATLTSEGALRAGAGLITLWTEGHPTPSPEIMVRQRAKDWTEVFELAPDALVIGPGLGAEHPEALFNLLESSSLPTVLDADALNLIASHNRHDLLTENIIATPHPGELARLLPMTGTRADLARAFTEMYPATLLFKGARTIVTKRGEFLHYNTTGTPGMACGGQGDLLSGVIGALLAQKLTSFEAGRAGAWICGRAAEKAQTSEQSLTPSDTANALGLAFGELFS
ncbi:MAG: NAD(P)H-hydrate dehydratase [Roseibacillus sp.]